MMMAEKITCLKRDAQSDLHFEMKIWKILIHPSIFFCLLPIPSKYQSLPQAPHKNKKKSSIPPKGDVHAAKGGNTKGGSPRHTKIKGKEKTLTTKDEGRTPGKD